MNDANTVPASKIKFFGTFKEVEEERRKKRSNAFLESGSRCEICDNFGVKNIPVRFPFVCDKCKKKKSTKLILEKTRIEGLIAHYIREVGVSFKKFESNFNQLSFQKKALIEIEKEIEKITRGVKE